MFESILVGSWRRVDVTAEKCVGGKVWPAGWRLLSQVDVDGNTLDLTAAVVQTFLHRLGFVVLIRSH